MFGSEPGEDDYNPLWEEIAVTWKAGVTPVLLLRDDQIDALQKAGKLTETRSAHRAERSDHEGQQVASTTRPQANETHDTEAPPQAGPPPSEPGPLGPPRSSGQRRLPPDVSRRTLA